MGETILGDHCVGHLVNYFGGGGDRKMLTHMVAVAYVIGSFVAPFEVTLILCGLYDG